ncbi:hypothetical protein AB0G35_15860 [Streptomyces sp. NPDC021749]
MLPEAMLTVSPNRFDVVDAPQGPDHPRTRATPEEPARRTENR